MEVQKKRKDFKSLTKVVRGANLEHIFMESCNVWRNMDFSVFEKVGADVSFEGTLFEDHQDYIIAKVNFSVKGLDENSKNREEIVTMECVYMLRYSLGNRKDLTSEDIETFCNMNSIYNAWPYWREFVQNMTNRMEIPTLTLPLLKFRPTPQKTVAEKKKQKF